MPAPFQPIDLLASNLKPNPSEPPVSSANSKSKASNLSSLDNSQPATAPTPATQPSATTPLSSPSPRSSSSTATTKLDLSSSIPIGTPFTAIYAQDNCHFTPQSFEDALLNVLRNPNITSSHLFRADVLYDSSSSSTTTTTNHGQRGEAVTARQHSELAANVSADSGTRVDSRYPGMDLSAEDRRTKGDVRWWDGAEIMRGDGGKDWVKMGSGRAPDEKSEKYEVARSLIRRLVPRNPQLDKPLEQSCHFLRAASTSTTLKSSKELGGQGSGDYEKWLVICVPHVDSVEALPWYHPAVKALAYSYVWTAGNTIDDTSNGTEAKDVRPKEIQTPEEPDSGVGFLAVYYSLFSDLVLPLPQRLQRTAYHLLATIYKHGHGREKGYEKKFHFDLLLPQVRVQNTYSALKQKYAKRLCDAWVEVTEPSKHVFEDLAIAAYLIELWRELYEWPASAKVALPSQQSSSVGKDGQKLPLFPGFVDIGCGNGVLTEVLLCEGFPGWGFDARQRKTWKVLSPETRQKLRELILIPRPLISGHLELPPLLPPPGYIPVQIDDSSAVKSTFSLALSRMSSIFSSVNSAEPTAQSAPSANDQSKWFDGLFPKGTFIISNHADELTAWTPLLASLSSSPFLAIPCCSHNLSGARFRAPSAFTGFTADASAPNYFAREKLDAAKQQKRPKHIAIHIPMTTGETDEIDGKGQDSGGVNGSSKPETGDLKAMSQASRSKQTSAYSSLCDWVAFLGDEAGFEVEKDMLRIPSTRNMAIIGRKWIGGQFVFQEGDVDEARRIEPERWKVVMAIVKRENGDGEVWIERARKLMSGEDSGKTVHG